MDQATMLVLFRAYNMYLEEVRWQAAQKLDEENTLLMIRFNKTGEAQEFYKKDHFYNPSFEGFMKWIGEKLEEDFTFQY